MSDRILARGDKVRFHPIIGGKHDGNVYTVRAVWDHHPGRVEPLVWLKEKSGAVTYTALSRYEKDDDGQN